MKRISLHTWLFALALAVTALVYWPGLAGGWLFDDYPNIVDNTGVQPHEASVPALFRAALSSPSSEFKRPLASLSFAANYLASGLNPYSWKLVNLLLHMLNGCLVFVLARALLVVKAPPPLLQAGEAANRTGLVAVLIAAGWLLLPINLTAVLYVVQRMESLANLFVLLGLIGYVAGRRWMLDSLATRGFWLCIASLLLGTSAGLLAKETAVMLPLYAGLVEWIVFGFARRTPTGTRIDKRIVGLFIVVLVLPGIIGLAWLLPSVLNPTTWATRDFTLHTRLLSEARIVVDYITWTLLPTPHALSFYHDQYPISTGLLQPWTTLTSLLALLALLVVIVWQRRQRPMLALGLAWFLGCQLLTATILPLELVYEHRNYFASLGLLLAVVPLLAAPMTQTMALPRRVLLVGLMLLWAALTAITAQAWGSPLSLAETLAARAPDSPRAQYELGRTYIMYSNYDPASPFTKLVYAPLERAAALPNASILPEQALIFFNARMHLPIKDAWWDSLIAKLKVHKPGVQDEGSLDSLTKCADHGECDLPEKRMVAAFLAALSHPHPSARLLSTYGDYAWNVLGDHTLGEQMTADAVATKPDEPAYHITLARMLAAQGRYPEVTQQISALQGLNIGGRLDRDIAGVRALLPVTTAH